MPSLLIASHIKPWKDSDPKTERTNPCNGLSLNTLHHNAFDDGIFTIDTDYRILISKTAKERYTSDVFSDFFEKYDYLSVDKQKIVNIKSLKIIEVDDKRFVIIGKDPDSHDLFIVNLEKNASQEYIIYQISDEQHILSEIKDANSFGTFINFVCFMTSHYSDSDLLELMAVVKLHYLK